jgi:hypothetical protein
MPLPGEPTIDHRARRCVLDMWGSLWGFPGKAAEM